MKTGETPNASEAVRRLLEVRKKKGGLPFKIFYSSKSAVELVAEGRGVDTTLQSSSEISSRNQLVSVRVQESALNFVFARPKRDFCFVKRNVIRISHDR